MPVHASSVISTTINTFDTALYVALTNIENNQYTVGTNGQLTEYQPLFQKMSDDIVTWMGVDRSGKIRDLIQGLYSYKVFVDLYATDSSLLATSDADTLMGMDGFRTRIKSDAVTYYDDYPTLTFSGNDITRSSGSWIDDGFVEETSITVAGSTSNNGALTTSTGGVTALILTVDETVTGETDSANVVVTGTGARMSTANMSTDTLLINNSFTSQEDPATDVLIAGYLPSISGQVFDMLFVDVTPLNTLSKDDLNTYIFDTLHYRTVFDNMNTGSYSAPPAP